MLQLRTGNYFQALRFLEELPEASFGCEYYFLFGESRAGMLDFVGASAAWRRALSFDPSLSARIADAKRQMMEEWIDCIEQHVRLEKKGNNLSCLLPVWLDRVADILLDGEEFPERLLSVWSEHQAWIEKCISSGELKLAELILAGWRTLCDRLPEVKVLHAKISAVRGECEKAVAIMQKVIAVSPDRPDWLALLVRYLLLARRFDEAVATLNKAVELDPVNALIWEEIGDILFADEDYGGAVLAYERCFLAQPAYLDSLCKMGQCYLAEDQIEAASAAFDAVLLKDPVNECAHLGRMSILNV